MRWPPLSLLDSTFRPIYLPSFPLMTPRTLLAFQPVALTSSSSVAPFERPTNARTVADLLPSRGPLASHAPFLGFLAFLVAFGPLVERGRTSRAGAAVSWLPAALSSLT